MCRCGLGLILADLLDGIARFRIGTQPDKLTRWSARVAIVEPDSTERTLPPQLRLAEDFCPGSNPPQRVHPRLCAISSRRVTRRSGDPVSAPA
eukprot:4042189-Prymnesium_polylepis.1